MAAELLRKDDILYNVLDFYTGESNTYSKVTTLHNGQPMNDSYVDGIMYIKRSTEYFKRNYSGPILLEWFGAKGDYNFITNTGTEDTEAVRKAVNYAALAGEEIRLVPGKKYLTDTIYAFQDDDLNPTFPSRPGRLKITTGSPGLATGDLEPQGAALVHINNAARSLFECRGSFSIESAGSTGGMLDFQNINFVGANMTTDVVHLELVVGQWSFKNLTIQGNNPSGNGCTLNNCWEGKMTNILIRGQSDNTLNPGAWTGIGLNITSNESGGQINMMVFDNVDVYKYGYNIRIGRRTSSVGTLSPIVFLGGQCSLADYHNMWIDGGCYNLVSIGQQFEGSRLNGVRIDSDGATDLPRNLKFINPYFTGGGRIQDGSADSFAVNIVDGEGVSFEAPLFNNLGNGILFDKSKCQGLVIERPVIRTVRSYGTSSGRFIDCIGTNNVIMRHRLIDPVFNQTPNVTVSDAAWETFHRTDVGGYLSISTNTETPSVSLGGGILHRVKRLNLNYSVATTITNILDGYYLREVIITSANGLVTIANNGNIFLATGEAFVMTNRSSLTLMWTGTFWIETARSNTRRSNLRENVIFRTGSSSVGLFENTVIVDASGGLSTITLPAAASAFDTAIGKGQKFTIKKFDNTANIVQVKGNGSELIDGINIQSIPIQYGYLEVQSIGTEWAVTARHLSPYSDSKPLIQVSSITDYNTIVGEKYFTATSGAANQPVAAALGVGFQLLLDGSEDNKRQFVNSNNKWYSRSSGGGVFTSWIEILDTDSALQGSKIASTYSVTGDANYTIPMGGVIIQLSAITANRNLTLPTASSYTGKTITILNRNTSAFAWNVVTPFYRGADGVNVTAVPSNSTVIIVSDGSVWRTIAESKVIAAQAFVTSASTTAPTKSGLNTTYGANKAGSTITYPSITGGGHDYRKLTDDSASDWVDTNWSDGVKSLTA